MPHDKNAGDFLREARKKAKLMQGDVAEELGYTSAQFISNWERGISFPPTDKLPYLAKLLRISHRKLVDKIFASKMAELEAARADALRRRSA